MLMLGGIGLFLLIHVSEIRSANAMAANFDIRQAKSLVNAGTMMARCTTGLATDRGAECGESAMAKVFEHFGALSVIGQGMKPGDGNYELSGGGFSNVAPDEVRLQQTLAQRCFETDGYSVGDRGLYGAGEASRINPAISLTEFLDKADRAQKNVLFAFAGDEDAQLKTYFEQRKLLVQLAHRFYGEDGLEIIRGAFAQPPHADVIAKLRERLKDRRFMKLFTPLERAELKLLVQAPGDFITCNARRRAARLAAKGT
jgi:hypothetical protein